MDRNNDSKIDRVVSKNVFEIVRYANEEQRKEEVKV